MRFILLILSLWFSGDAEQSPASNADSGCGMDPLGRCSAPHTDEGCHIDPLGGCRD